MNIEHKFKGFKKCHYKTCTAAKVDMEHTFSEALYAGLNSFPVLAAPLVKSPNSFMDHACCPGDKPLKLASIRANSMFT